MQQGGDTMRHSGAVAEWLGRGLQSLVHQFDSGRRLDTSLCRGFMRAAPDRSARYLLSELAHLQHS